MWPILWLFGVSSFFLLEKMSGFYSVCVGRRRRDEDVVFGIFKSVLIKIKCMQRPCGYCHGFFQARFMSLLIIKLRQRSYNQICWCRSLGNCLGSASPASHSWWTASPLGNWHYGVVCVQKKTGQGLCPGWAVTLMGNCVRRQNMLCVGIYWKSTEVTGTAMLTFQR